MNDKIKNSKITLHLYSLLWRNFILKVRSPLATFFELLIPILVISAISNISKPKTRYQKKCFGFERGLLSLSPFFNGLGYLCYKENPCSFYHTVNSSVTDQLNDLTVFFVNYTNVMDSLDQIYFNLASVKSWMNSNPLLFEKLYYLSKYYLDNKKTIDTFLKMMELFQNKDEAFFEHDLFISEKFCGDSSSMLLYNIGVFWNSDKHRKEDNSEESCIERKKQIFPPTGAHNAIWGKIYYTNSQSPLVKEIIKRMNQTFQVLDTFRLAAVQWRVKHIYYAQLHLLHSRKSLELLGLFRNCNGFGDADKIEVCNNMKVIADPTNIDRILTSMSIMFALAEYSLNCTELNKFEPIQDFDELTINETKRAYAGLDFSDLKVSDTPNNPPKLLKYTIRMSSQVITTQLEEKMGLYKSQELEYTYFDSGFLNLQQLVSDAYISILRYPNADILPHQPLVGSILASTIISMPRPCLDLDDFFFSLAMILPTLIMICFVVSYCLLVKSIINEKEEGLRQHLYLFGVKRYINWLAWMITALVIFNLVTIVMVIVMRVNNIFTFSNYFMIYIFLLFYLFALTCQILLVASLISNSNLGGIIAAVIYFVAKVPSTLVNPYVYLGVGRYYIGSLFAQTALVHGFNIIALWENERVGLQWWNIHMSIPFDIGFSIGHVMLMFIIDSIIYLSLAFYFDSIIPAQYGTALPWYFFLTKEYWRGEELIAQPGCCNFKVGTFFWSKGGVVNNTKNNKGDNIKQQNKSNEYDDNYKIGISIKKLRKSYGNFVAVDNLSLDFYEGQITGFLGHNGAGKTTTISILTGMIPPTSGTVKINNIPLSEYLQNKDCTNTIGFCPQHNVLYNQLTVKDHIYFYGQLRGLEKKELIENTESILYDVGLLQTGYSNSYAKALSGGYKRKLSIALAFLGNSRVVFLDEPTAGIDPFARRGIWDLLLKYKRSDRTIILTTHHMDEADFLSDRIAIISRGRLLCVGTGVSLKRDLGRGYYLNIERGHFVHKYKQHNVHNVNEFNVKLEPFELRNVDESRLNDLSIKHESHEILRFIKKYYPHAQITEERSQEIIILLPKHKNDQMINLLRELEKPEIFHDKLLCKSFGITDTSLEEVFINVIKKDEMYNRKLPLRSSQEDLKTSFIISRRMSSDFDDDIMSMRSKTVSRSGTTETAISPTLVTTSVDRLNVLYEKGCKLYIQQICGMFLKRFYDTKRNYKSLLIEIILPTMIILIVQLWINFATQDPTQNQPLIIMNIDLMKIFGTDHKTFRIFFTSEYPTDPEKYKNKNYSSDAAKITDNLVKVFKSTDELSKLSCHASSPSSNLSTCDSTCGDADFPRIDSLPKEVSRCECNDVFCNRFNDPVGKNRVKKIKSGYIHMDLSYYNISDFLYNTFWNYEHSMFGGLEMLFRNQMATAFHVLSNSAQLPPSKPMPDILLPTKSYYLEYMAQVAAFMKLKLYYIRIWARTEGYGSEAVHVNVVDNLLIRYTLVICNKTTDNNYAIQVQNHPFKYGRDGFQRLLILISIEFQRIIYILFALSLIPASFIIFQIEERVNDAKQLQFVSGLSPFIFWFVNFIWDLLRYIITITLIIIVLIIINQESYVGEKNRNAFCLLLYLYGFAIIPWIYPFTFFISSPSSGFVIIFSSCMIIGLSLIMMATMFDSMQSHQKDKDLEKRHNFTKNLFLLFPQYVVARGIMELAQLKLRLDIESFGGSNDKVKGYNPFDWDLMGKKYVALVVVGVICLLILVLLENGIFSKIKQKISYLYWIKQYPSSINNKSNQNQNNPDNNTDIDINNERDNCRNYPEDYTLLVDDLLKIYATLPAIKCPLTCQKSSVGCEDCEKNNILRFQSYVLKHTDYSNAHHKRNAAVNRITFGIKKGECFGLLGTNGAGKSTTFKILTGVETKTDGIVKVCDVPVERKSVAFKSLGFCPQFDALHPYLTVEEELRVFALFRGISIGSETELVIDNSIKALNLESERKKLSKALSGGNKRKLSTAIALLSDPQIILLDEPTAGVDASSRRFLWTQIQELTARGSENSVLMTSHNMEECEVLCHRLAIMVDGQLKCIGSVQHLRDRFGLGYMVKLHLPTNDAENNRTNIKLLIKNIVKSDNPEEEALKLYEESLLSLSYKFEPRYVGGLTFIFEYFNNMKVVDKLIIDFSVTQGTLDDIFLEFTDKKHEDELKSKI